MQSAGVGDHLLLEALICTSFIRIEIVHPQSVKEDEINRSLARVDQPPLGSQDFAPLKATYV